MSSTYFKITILEGKSCNISLSLKNLLQWLKKQDQDKVFLVNKINQCVLSSYMQSQLPEGLTAIVTFSRFEIYRDSKLILMTTFNSELKELQQHFILSSNTHHTSDAELSVSQATSSLESFMKVLKNYVLQNK